MRDALVRDVGVDHQVDRAKHNGNHQQRQEAQDPAPLRAQRGIDGAVGPGRWRRLVIALLQLGAQAGVLLVQPAGVARWRSNASCSVARRSRSDSSSCSSASVRCFSRSSCSDSAAGPPCRSGARKTRSRPAISSPRRLLGPEFRGGERRRIAGRGRGARRPRCPRRGRPHPADGYLRLRVLHLSAERVAVDWRVGAGRKSHRFPGD